MQLCIKYHLFINIEFTDYIYTVCVNHTHPHTHENKQEKANK